MQYPREYDTLEDVFHQIGEYQKHNHIRVVMPIFPLIYDYNRYRWQDINDLIIKLCTENNITYVSLLGDYRKFDYDELRVERGEFTHPSVTGKGVAAEAILKTIMKEGLFKSEQ
jgi:hypothetical protein